VTAFAVNLGGLTYYIILSLLLAGLRNTLKYRVLTPRKVMQFKKGIFQAWKVMENNYGHGKVMEFYQ